MLYKTSLTRLLLALVLVAPSVVAQQSAGADAGRLRAHVAHLASEKLEGRRTGTPGAEAAARYVAEEFKRLGLEPGGDAPGANTRARSFLQTFPYVSGVELGKGNSMTVSAGRGRRELRAGEDWMPLGFSANGRVERAEVAFVGYGITASELNHDDYKSFDARGKVAFALSGTPDGENPHGQFARAGDARFKAAAARAAGARALALVAREPSLKEERLARLAYDNAGDAGLPVVVVSRQAAAALLGLDGLEGPAGLDEFEKNYQKAASGTAAHGGTQAVVPLPPAGLTVSLATEVTRRSAPAANVVGVLPGSDPRLKEEAIVVGAHYDHLGRGGHGSLAPREGEVHHGADDNASGTAALIELARTLSADKGRMRRTLVFVAFGGEEEGLLGSKFYTEHPARPLAQTVAMFNLDMVGRLREDALSISGVGTAEGFRAMLEEANNAFDVSVYPAGDGPEPRPADAGVAASVVVVGSNGRVAAVAAPRPAFRLRLNEDGFGPSDHASFYARQVPVLFFFTGPHEDYHKPSDTAERVNYEGLRRVTDFVRGLVAALQARDERPAFTRAKVEATPRAAGFRVYLGTIPTYGESTDGLKLDGVREGSPAATAGLRAGDLIVKLAGRDVRNVYDYTQALSEMKAGQEYEVEFVRDGHRQTARITPAARR